MSTGKPARIRTQVQPMSTSCSGGPTVGPTCLPPNSVSNTRRQMGTLSSVEATRSQGSIPSKPRIRMDNFAAQGAILALRMKTMSDSVGRLALYAVAIHSDCSGQTTIASRGQLDGWVLIIHLPGVHEESSTDWQLAIWLTTFRGHDQQEPTHPKSLDLPTSTAA